jgi:hypothetical protein
MYSKSIVLVILFFLSANIFAQQKSESSSSDDASRRSTFKHAINVCPIAPIMGIYSLNYEYLVSPKNGLVARVEYEDVPKSYTDANIETNGMAYYLNYRRHFSGEMNSIFIGAFARYRKYNGSGEIESDEFDFTLPSVTVGLNAGKRWAWDSGFNVTFSVGYGYIEKFRQASPSNLLIESMLDQLEKDYDFMNPMYAELSAGYAF